MHSPSPQQYRAAIKLAARYAALEGGLSAGAYAATVPAAVATVMVDIAFITQLQLRLAYDIPVL
ncbi:hypothetical protein ACFVZC_30120 [Streptomyces marokkonensis]|uniref:Uncharacterized protein n=1 Tax=Streptomyces marokkonensis TaxID=324855 RepID=A0ABW6QEG1_9ACTN